MPRFRGQGTTVATEMLRPAQSTEISDKYEERADVTGVWRGKRFDIDSAIWNELIISMREIKSHRATNTIANYRED